MSCIASRPVSRMLGALLLTVLAALPGAAQTYASSVFSSSGLGSNGLYNNPAAALGQPTTLINGVFDTPPQTYHASMVYPAYATDPNGSNLLVSLGATGSVTVKFDTPIVHSDQHWYGDDFIVYGNSFFASSTGVTPTTDMSKVQIGSMGSIFQNGVPVVSVSADGVHFTQLASPVWYPTNPYAWVGNSAQNPSGWDDSHLQDFTKPVNPFLTPSSFSGVSVATAANTLYAGSAGGAAFSLAGLTDASGNALTSVQYIQFSGGGGSGAYNIDAVARVSSAAPVPECGTLISLVIGLVGVGFLRRRRAQA